MPANKNALIRYKTIDRCLSNPYRRWTIDDLIDACSDALYEFEGITKGVSRRTVEGDLQIMRSDKLGYNAPIEVYDNKYYRYSDPDFSITNMPLSENDIDVMREAVGMLRQLTDFDQFTEMSDIVGRLQDRLALNNSAENKPIIHFDSVPGLKGLKWLTPLYQFIKERHTLRVMYQSFRSRSPKEFILYPHILKEFRNRWFLFGTRARDHRLFNLALDRIVSVEPVNDVPYRDNPEFGGASFFDDVIGVSKDIGSRPETIRLWVSREEREYILTKPLHQSQTVVQQNGDGSIEVEINVAPNLELYSVLMSYTPRVIVLSPEKVRQQLLWRLKKATELYESAL